MIENAHDFHSFAELDAELNRLICALNRLGMPSINGLIDYDISYTVNGVPGMVSIFRAGDCWTFMTEI